MRPQGQIFALNEPKIYILANYPDNNSEEVPLVLDQDPVSIF